MSQQHTEGYREQNTALREMCTLRMRYVIPAEVQRDRRETEADQCLSEIIRADFEVFQSSA